MENEVCTGGNEPCRLWFADSVAGHDAYGQSREAAEIRLSRMRQRERNEAYLKERRLLSEAV